MDPLALHRAAVAAYVEAAAALDGAGWHAPVRAAGWTPAEITEHLRLVYVVALQELDGGAGPRLRLGRLQRLALRVTVVRRLLAGGPFPRGAPAPRELRPKVAAEQGQEEALAALRRWSERFVAAVAAAGASPRKRLTHPYFGALPLPDMVLVLARHLDHHRGQLPSRAPPAR